MNSATGSPLAVRPSVDNGTRQTVDLLAASTLPVSVVLALDTSASLDEAQRMHLVRASTRLVDELRPDESAALVTFSGRVIIPTTFTADTSRLRRLVAAPAPSGDTALRDGVHVAMVLGTTAPGRPLIILLSDGEDTASRRGSGEALDRARLEEVMVYSVGLENEFYNGGQRVRTSPDRGLRKLSEETGGGFFVLKKKDELGATFTRVAQELHAQYVMGFTPENLDGKIHKLEVRVKKPGMTARARRSYLASPTTVPTNGKQP